MDRRRFLKVSAAGAATLAVAGALGAWSTPARPTHAPPDLKALGPRTWAIVMALGPVFIGPDLTDPARLAGRVDDYLATVHPRASTEVQQGMELLENRLTNLWLVGVAKPFSHQDPAQQARTLDAWRTSEVALCATIYTALRKLIDGTFWGDPENYALTGYPGPYHLRPRTASHP